MEQLQAILTAFVDFITKLAGDNESLKGIFDTLKSILDKFIKTEDAPTE